VATTSSNSVEVSKAKRLGRAFFARHSSVVAPELLSKILVVGSCVGRITEVEAYGGSDDAASHAARGQTPRNTVMFGPAGVLYVYFTYGMHHCANIVTGPVGDAQAVLLRGVEALEGIEEMRLRRPKARRDRDLANGPGKLCAAFDIDLRHNSLDLTKGPIGIFDDGFASASVVATSRVGITKAVDTLWRWSVI
jgi:DNA-3-methyladenine glycosylase